MFVVRVAVVTRKTAQSGFLRCFSHSVRRFQQEHENLSPYVELPYAYAYGRSLRSLQHLSIGDILDKQLREKPNRTAVVSHHEGLSKTFSELTDEVNQVSRLLENLGVKRGDVVGLWACNSIPWLLVQYATARVGAILCTVNPAYKVPELEYALQKAKVKVLFMPGKGSPQTSINNFYDLINTPSLVKSLETNSFLKHVVLMDGEGKDKIGSTIPVHSFNDLKRREKTSEVNFETDAGDPAIIMFTSGTTGKPKGACLSHFTLTNNAELTARKIGIYGPEIVTCMPLPLFHSFACVLGSIAMCTTGSKLVLTGYKFDVKSVVDVIVKHSCTHIMLTPTMLIDILNYVEKNDVKITSLKGILCGGASVPVEVAHQVSQVIPSVNDVRIGYGATELGPCTTGSTMDDSEERRMETVGAPLDFVEVKLVNPHTGQLVKTGEQGELLARGHNVMLGYWDEEEKTKEAITEGKWYKTGDMATMDEHGYVKIVGRTKEMIIRGGENIYPREIEEVLHEHPDILDAYVVGVPDDRMGEECCAWIKLRNASVELSADDVKAFCKDKITYFKIPRYVMFVDSFPLTSTGKAQKFIMREKSCEQLGLKERK